MRYLCLVFIEEWVFIFVSKYICELILKSFYSYLNKWEYVHNIWTNVHNKPESECILYAMAIIWPNHVPLSVAIPL